MNTIKQILFAGLLLINASTSFAQNKITLGDLQDHYQRKVEALEKLSAAFEQAESQHDKISVSIPKKVLADLMPLGVTFASIPIGGMAVMAEQLYQGQIGARSQTLMFKLKNILKGAVTPIKVCATNKYCALITGAVVGGLAVISAGKHYYDRVTFDHEEFQQLQSSLKIKQEEVATIESILAEFNSEIVLTEQQARQLLLEGK